ncbi:Gpi16 subunit, GPI transamidase component [Agrocybe pediades]|nr:Gpi16 subunit, GPI transamidase component [Agrocybe pediades]
MLSTSKTLILWPLTVLCLAARVTGQEVFDEKLSLRTLQDGKVESTFTFTTLLKGTLPRDPRTLDEEDLSQHYKLFPLALGQILREYAITELHLNINAGNWNYDRWGYPEEKGVGTGAELWAWLGDGATKTVDERWRGLRNALAGLFCASLGSLDELRTTSPAETFTPEGTLPTWGDSLSHQLRHASLPSEHVCTENLTPFLKLLPCKSLSGIATLLNPHRLFDADWHGMGVHVLWREEQGIEMRLTFQSVSDPLRSGLHKKPDWSMQSLFDRTITRTCPVARTSEIMVSLPQNAAYHIRPEPSSVSGSVALYDVASVEKPLNVDLLFHESLTYPLEYRSDSVPFTVRRVLLGSTQTHGQLSVTITNQKPYTVQALYLETMPWLVQFYLHTLQAKVDGVIQDGIISNITYIPPVAHSRPTTFQALLTLPAQTTVHITMDVTKAFLRYTEHLPDAQRGWDLPPAVFTPLEVGPLNLNDTNVGQKAEEKRRIYTSTLLVDLATPDFSMPYNVIIFTCSVVAFIFGNVFNLLTRRFVVVRLEEDKGKKE